MHVKRGREGIYQEVPSDKSTVVVIRTLRDTRGE